MREIVIARLMLLLCVAPLAALLLVSLGLAVLKRRSSLSPWMARLAAPPFYLVSLPIATLVAGAEMLGLYSLLVYGLWSPQGIFWSLFFERIFNLLLGIYFAHLFLYNHLWFVLEGPAIIAFLVGFWVSTFGSGYLLWRTVWREDHQSSSRIASQRLRGLFLLIGFAWSVIYLVTYIGTLMVPFGPSSVG
jgi:hypothetical protein